MHQCQEMTDQQRPSRRMRIRSPILQTASELVSQQLCGHRAIASKLPRNMWKRSILLEDSSLVSRTYKVRIRTSTLRLEKQSGLRQNASLGLAAVLSMNNHFRRGTLGLGLCSGVHTSTAKDTQAFRCRQGMVRTGSEVVDRGLEGLGCRIAQKRVGEHCWQSLRN
jgi:hypothetical protein